jgi:hypothetical protein
MTVGFYCRAGLIRAQFVAATLRLQLDRSRSIQLIGNSRQPEVHERDLPLELDAFKAAWREWACTLGHSATIERSFKTAIRGYARPVALAFRSDGL